MSDDFFDEFIAEAHYVRQGDSSHDPASMPRPSSRMLRTFVPFGVSVWGEALFARSQIFISYSLCCNTNPGVRSR
jgi:hypothetical protein